MEYLLIVVNDNIYELLMLIFIIKKEKKYYQNSWQKEYINLHEEIYFFALVEELFVDEKEQYRDINHTIMMILNKR
jgi:hypothetical protein